MTDPAPTSPRQPVARPALQEFRTALNALYLEVEPSIANDIVRLANAAIAEAEAASLPVQQAQPPTPVNFVSEVIPDAPNPSCHVCGALMIAVEWRCLSCQASTKPTELNQETVTPQQWATVRKRLIQLAQKMNAASSHNTTEGK